MQRNLAVFYSFTFHGYGLHGVNGLLMNWPTTWLTITFLPERGCSSQMVSLQRLQIMFRQANVVALSIQNQAQKTIFAP